MVQIFLIKFILLIFLKKNDKFTIHNSGVNCQTKSYNSISDLIFQKSNGKAKGIMLIGIKRKISI